MSMLHELYKEVRDAELSRLAELGYGAYIYPSGAVRLHILGNVAKRVGPKYMNLTLAFQAASAKARREARRAGGCSNA